MMRRRDEEHASVVRSLNDRYASRRVTRPHRGMTLVELLVVTALIAMLMSLLLPAVNAARESGRRTTCMNNLRNLALASLNHDATHGFLPSGGWGGAWVGIPGRGIGPRQPGAWGYTLLQFLERSDLVEFGSNSEPPERDAHVAAVLQTTLAVMYCPSRRLVRRYPVFFDHARQPRGSAPVFEVARTDYAMNCGDQPRCEIANWFNPPSLEAGDDPTFPWPDVSDHTGVSYLRSQITMAHLRDGGGNTLLLAEKHLSVANYETGADHGDDWSLYTGYQDDVYRSTYEPAARDGHETRTCRFGSAHAAIWNASFCDGSVRPLSFDINLGIHRSLGNRADGLVFDENELR